MILSWYFECRLQSITGSFNFFFFTDMSAENTRFPATDIFSIVLSCPITEDLVSRAGSHLQVLTFMLSTVENSTCAYVKLNRLPKTVNSPQQKINKYRNERRDFWNDLY